MSKKKNKIEKSESLSKNAWRKFKKDKLALFGLSIIIISSIIAIFGSHLRPDKSEHANQRIAEIKFKQPGFSTIVLLEKNNRKTQQRSFYDKMFFGGKDNEFINHAITENYAFEGDKLTWEIYSENGKSGSKKEKHVADILYPLSYDNQFAVNPNNQDEVSFITVNGEKITRSISEMKTEIEENNIINRTYWLGTDRAGRDMLSLIMASLLVSLSVGLIAVLISLTIGITLGALAGYFRGWVDEMIMWIINVIWSIPTLLLVIAISVSFGKDFTIVFIAVGITMWVEVARIVRGSVLSIREKEFIEAGKALGYKSYRIIFKHVLPNVVGPIIVVAAANFAAAILIEAGLSFVGIGVEAPQPSLGGMVNEYKDYIRQDGMPYLVILPGLAIVILVLSFMLIGNGLRDALDNKSIETSGE